ncbi:MAG: Uncharacterised protein [Alphaproteobacteria bacterium UBA4588]|nr:MAG: Uncharacterised protein [Alphaproteobacteria bacterium UBA4588]
MHILQPFITAVTMRAASKVLNGSLLFEYTALANAPPALAISGIYTAPGSISVAVAVSGKEILMCTSTLCVYSNQ